MALIIKNRAVVNDDWTVVRAAEDGALPAVDALGAGKVLVPLFAVERAQGRARRVAFEGRTRRVARARRRTRRPRGRLRHDRARRGRLPEVPRRPRLFASAACCASAISGRASCAPSATCCATSCCSIARCGFDAFAVRADKDIDDALNAFDEFSERYQGAIDDPEPLFRRRAALAAASGASTMTPELQAKVARARRAARFASRNDHAPVELASSLGAEDMVLTHRPDRARRLPIGIFTLDTGRLHAETLGMIDRVQRALRLRHRAVSSAARSGRGVSSRDHGLERVLRQRRAAQALLRHPQGRAARPRARRTRAPGSPASAASSRRRASSCTRKSTTRRATSRSSIRSPTGREGDVWDYLRAIDVPVQRAARPRLSEHRLRALHARRSRPGEDIRAGRWWWEVARHEGMRPALSTAHPDSRESRPHAPA